MIRDFDIPDLKRRDTFSDIDFYEMDDREFELRFGIPKSDLLGEDAFMRTAGVAMGRIRRVPYDDLPGEQFIEERQASFNGVDLEELESKTGDKTSHKTGKSAGKKAPSPSLEERGTGVSSPAPKAGLDSSSQKKTTKGANTSIDLLDARKKAYKESLVAGKAFELYIRNLARNTRGKMQRSQINLLRRAVERKLKEQNIKVGTQEWVKVVQGFFPEAPVSVTVPKIDAKESGSKVAQTGEQTPAVEDTQQGDAKGVAPVSAVDDSAQVLELYLPIPGQAEAKAGKEKTKNPEPAVIDKKTAPSKETGNKTADARTNENVDADQAKKSPVKAQKHNNSSKVNKEGLKNATIPSPSPALVGGEAIKIIKSKSTEQLIEKTSAKTDALPRVGGELGKKSESIAREGKEKIKAQALEQKKAKSAVEKLSETKKAVQPPAQEAESVANISVIDDVKSAETPETKPLEAKDSIDREMQKRLPKSEGDLKDLAETNVSEDAAREMNKLIGGQTAGVKNNYEQIDNTPAPVLQAAEAPLPAIEETPAIPALNLSKGLLPQADAEQSDFQDYVKASDEAIENELQTPELLKEFETSDARPFVEVRELKGEIETEADNAPADTQKLEQEEQQKVQQSLNVQEKSASQQMVAQREQGLKNAQSEQEGGKLEMELERERVSVHINGVYERTNAYIHTKLDLLELTIEKEFIKGQAKAFEVFETGVDEDLEEFFAERYEGGWGFWRRVGDFFMGTEELEGVQDIFNKHREIFVTTINSLIEELSQQTEQVIQECKDILEDSRTEIEDYVAGLEGSLKQYAQTCQANINEKLEKLEEEINQKEEELIAKLEEMREQAIEAIDRHIEERKKKMKGALSKLGSLVLDLAMRFFKWTLKNMGMDPNLIFGYFNNTVETITLLVTDPGQFFKNLGSAVKLGLNNFQGNFKQHFIGGMIEWLSGVLDGMVQIPDNFDLRGMVQMGLSVLNLTYPNVREKLVKHTSENIVSAAENGFEVVSVLVTEGPMGLWEYIKDEAVAIKEQVIASVRQWAITNIVKSAVLQIAMMLNPVGAIVKAIISIYDFVRWLIDNINRIMSFVNSVASSIKNIAIGQIGGAADYIENALARTIPMILSGLARFLKLNGIAKAVQRAIKKIRKPIDKALDKGIGFIVKKLKKGGKWLKNKVNSAVGKVKEWWKKKKKFTTKAGEEHTVFFKGGEKSAKLMVASDPMPYAAFLQEAKNNPENRKVVKIAGKKASKVISITKKLQAATDEKEKLIIQQESALNDFTNEIKKLPGGVGVVADSDIIIDWAKKQISFITLDGGNHHIKFKLRGTKVIVMVHSSPLPIETLLDNEISSQDGQNKKIANEARKYYVNNVLTLIDEIEQLDKKRDTQIGEERKKTRNKIELKEKELRKPLQVLGKKLAGLDLDRKSGLAVASNVQPIANGVVASPLTFLPGNTTGSSPTIDIPGWEHAQKLNAVHDEWVKGHLLSEKLHGPGNEKWNLVVIDKVANGNMSKSVEQPAIKRAKELWKSEKEEDQNTVLYYKTTYTKHGGKPPVSDFGDEITVEWGEQRVVPGQRDKFTSKDEKDKRNFTSHKPQESAEEIVYNINSIGEPTLVKEFGFTRTFARNLPIALKKGVKNWQELEITVRKHFKKNHPKFTEIDVQIDKLEDLLLGKKIIF